MQGKAQTLSANSSFSNSSCSKQSEVLDEWMQPSRARDEFYFQAKINESQQGPPIGLWAGLGADLIYPGELSSEKV